MDRLVFSSATFLVIFFLVAVVYYFSRSTMRTIILCLFNTSFYLSFGLSGYVVIIFVIMFSYVLARLKEVKKINIFIMSVILVLLFFKYLGGNLNIMAPLGISFFTFKVIGYMLDVKNGKYEPEVNFFNYYNYVLFFPQIVSGPIQRYDSFKDELDDLDRTISYNQLRDGAVLFFFGLFEKIIISTRISIVVDYVFNNLSLMYGWYVVLAVVLYGMQLYTDFDGYSNIAIGLAKMLGINTPSNFNVPYLACNLSSFWRRWHISLSSWFRDYLYIPLGGNRKGRFRKYVNLMVVSVVSGLWHGNSINFFTWGMLHGFGQIVGDAFNKGITKRINSNFVKVVMKVLGMVVTFSFVNFCWIFFRLDFEQALLCISHMIKFSVPFSYINLEVSYFDWVVLLLLLVLVVVSDIYRYFYNDISKFTGLPFVFRWFVYFLVVFLFILLYQYNGSYVNNFIYGNF